MSTSTHAFLSGLRYHKWGAYLEKAPLEVTEPSATWGSLKYRILASCWRHCAWTEGRLEVQCLTWKPHSSSLADTLLCIVLQSSDVEQAAVAKRPISNSWRMWRDCFTSHNFFFRTTFHIQAKTLLRAAQLVRPSTLPFKEEIKDLADPLDTTRAVLKGLTLWARGKKPSAINLHSLPKNTRVLLPQRSV